MRLVQEDLFSPIAIVLETREEAELFWKIVREVDAVDPAACRMAAKLSNLFSNEAKL